MVFLTFFLLFLPKCESTGVGKTSCYPEVGSLLLPEITKRKSLEIYGIFYYG